MSMSLNFLASAEVIARGLRWEVVESQAEGGQTRVHLRGAEGIAGAELMARRRHYRLVIVTPAGTLLTKWRIEMNEPGR